jgi:hypothetical protein
VANVLPDGKLELSLRGHAHVEVEADARKLLALLSQPAAPRIGDHSDPATIRSLLGFSKKVLKRSAGRLLKQRLITVDPQGWFQVVAKKTTG